MTGFQIFINDVPICMAGVGEYGVLAAVLAWVRRRDDQRPPGLPDELWTPEELTFDVSESAINGDAESDKRQWISQNLSVGDRIRIEIVDVDDSNAESGHFPHPAKSAGPR